MTYVYYKKLLKKYENDIPWLNQRTIKNLVNDFERKHASASVTAPVPTGNPVNESVPTENPITEYVITENAATSSVFTENTVTTSVTTDNLVT